MNFCEELEDCKYSENEVLVDHLVEVIKDEGINSLDELKEYEEKYFTDSEMSKEAWVKYYEESFKTIPEIDNMDNDETVIKIKNLRNELYNTTDFNIKIKNIILISVLLEKEFCFLVEAYNLIMSGSVANIEEYVGLKNIVLCGSMKVKDDILYVAQQLKMLGFNPLLPLECLNNEPKNVASRSHFDRIVKPANTYILVVNAKKDGIDNYIGANSIAEVGLGFYYNKKVFVLNDYYEPYKDELEGWGVVALKGNLKDINNVWHKAFKDIK